MIRRGAAAEGRLPSASREFRTRVAWMPQTITAMTGLTAREQVAYTGWLRGMNRADAWAAAVIALDRVQMGERADTKTRQLSGGQLRRVLRDLILRLATDEVQVLMSTHDVADLAEEADLGYVSGKPPRSAAPTPRTCAVRGRGPARRQG